MPIFKFLIDLFLIFSFSFCSFQAPILQGQLLMNWWKGQYWKKVLATLTNFLLKVLWILPTIIHFFVHFFLIFYYYYYHWTFNSSKNCPCWFSVLGLRLEIKFTKQHWEKTENLKNRWKCSDRFESVRSALFKTSMKWSIIFVG